MNVNAIASVITLVVVPLLLACTPAGPTLEKADDPGADWIELGPALIESLEIERAGAEVRASGVFAHAEDRVSLSIVLVLEPQARFVSGSHRSRISANVFEGPVSAESVEFFGGQNEGPSVGGVFVLENSTDPVRYRLRIPPSLRR